jgi:DNA-binding winged helix-turn-helix (wHTH) protein/serine/threonine protein kinase
MIFDAWSAEEQEFSSRLWSFAQCDFDESSRELRVNGKAVELESKPLEVLYQLLVHGGAVVRKDELLESVWPGVTVVDGSLATAVSKLRKALGDDDSPIVLTVPRIGYRLGVPVNCKRLAAPRLAQLDFKPGDAVPGRDQWRLVRPLGKSEANEVWFAEHSKTHELRVFKFAADGVRLRALKREVTLSRFLHESLGARADFVRVLEWNFDTAPYYLESEYCGSNLAEWSEAQGGLAKIPFETRLQVLVDVARAVAAAHEVGVLHKDLKPANVLAAPTGEGGWHIKVADFGSGWLLDPVRLNALGITNLGFTQSEIPQSDPLTGTLMYLAPEVLAGQSSTASADVYALGVMLYQLAAGDFRKPLSPGWEAGIEDPLIREDIADAACGDPAKRLGGAAALADRLESLPQRRIARDELELTRQRAQTAERRLAKTRARRPWLIATALALTAGLAASLGLYRNASHERDRANHQTAIAAAVSQFLAGDLLGRSDPFQSGRSGETLVDAVKKASPDIDRQFHDTPEVAARLHQAIARALDNRSDFPDARQEYDRAARLFTQAGGPSSQEAVIVQLQRASMEARTYEKGSLPRARAILAAQEPRMSAIAQPWEDLAVWLATARGMIALIDNDAKQAVGQFQTASDRAATLPAFDENARLTLKQRLAFAFIRLGNGGKAEQLFRDLIADFSRVQGQESPAVLRVRLNLAQAFMIQSKHKEAIEETTRIYPAYVARLGEDHELAMQVLATRAQSEMSLGQWDDAIRDDLKIHELAVHKQGPLSFYAVATLTDAALAQCRKGLYAAGEPNARQAFEASAKAFGERAGLTGGAAYSLASCELGLGKLPEAASLLAQIDPQAVAQLAGIPDWFANVELAQAEIASRRGDHAAARKHLQAAAPAFSRADAEPYQKRALETLAAAERRN